MVEQLSPIPELPERNPNMIDPGAIPQAPVPAAPTAAPAPAGGAPAPEAVPTTPAPASSQAQSLETDDPRYKDAGWVVISDMIVAGAMPWLMATADVATGRVPQERFEEVRQEHQMRINGLKERHPEFVSAVENALPFLSGLGMGIAGKTRGVISNTIRGASAGAAHSSVSGYTENVEEPTLSGKRLGEATGKAVFGAVTGAAGGAAGSIPAVRSRAKSAAAEKQAKELAERSAAAKQYFVDKKRKETAAVKKYEKEEQAAAEQKKKDAEAAAAQKKEDAELKAANEQLRKVRLAVYAKKPSGRNLDTNWAGNMTKFIKNPIDTVKAMSSEVTGIRQLAEKVNMSPSAVALAVRKDMAKRSGKYQPDTAEESKIYSEINGIWDDMEASGIKLPGLTTHKGTDSVN